MCNTANDYNSSLFCDGSGGVRRAYVFPTFKEDGTQSVRWLLTDGMIDSVEISEKLPVFSLKKWQVEAQTATFTDQAVGERTNKAFARQQQATFVFHGSSDELVRDLNEMGRSRLTLIIEDNRGLLHLLFKDNGGTFRDNFTPGTAVTDSYAHTITLDGVETDKAMIVPSSVLDTLQNYVPEGEEIPPVE